MEGGGGWAWRRWGRVWRVGVEGTEEGFEERGQGGRLEGWTAREGREGTSH